MPRQSAGRRALRLAAKYKKDEKPLDKQ